MLTALALIALIGASAVIVAQRRLIANLRSLAATQERSITVRDGMLSTQAEALSLLEDSNLWWEIAARGWQERAEELGERLVPVELEQITPDRRRTDAELDEAFKVAAPHLLGSLLDLAAAVLEVLPGIHVSNLPRMADFGRLLAALDEVKGWRSLDAYRAAVEQVAADVVAGDPLAAGIVEWMSDKSKWTGTATELLQRLSSYRPDGAGWPRTAKTMSGALARLAPALRGQGMHVTKSRSGTTRTITIEHRSSDASDASDARPHLRVETREREEAPEERDSPVSAASRASRASSPPVEMF